MNNKKEVSALIATVLIVGIVIALSFLVTTWITGTVENDIGNIDCEIEAQNLCLELTDDLKLSSGTSAVIFTNEGPTDIKNITIVQFALNGSTISSNDPSGINSYSSHAQSTDAGAFQMKAFITVFGEDGLCEVGCNPVTIEI